MNFPTRLSWRPPSNCVSAKIRTSLSASSAGTYFAPMQITFALLCRRENFAQSSLWQSAARIPRTLFAAIDIPIPVVHSSTPEAGLADFTSAQTFAAKSGVVYARLVESAFVGYFEVAGERGDRGRVFEVDCAVVATYAKLLFHFAGILKLRVLPRLFRRALRYSPPSCRRRGRTRLCISPFRLNRAP